MSDYRVIKIVNDTSLVINAGENHNICVGDKFQIVGAGTPIIDPKTKENLGSLDIIKDTLQVSVVYEKMCLCEAPPTFIPILGPSITNLLGRTEQKPLNIDPTEISGTLNEESPIKIGDSARHIPKPKDVETV